MDLPQSGLDPAIVDRWRQNNGGGGELGSNRSRQVRTRGRRGIELYAVLVELEADDPDGFEQLVYWRPLSKLFTFCYLQTPVRTRRTPSRIQDYPSNFLIVAVQSIGFTTGEANGQDYASRTGHLTITDSRYPYDLTTHGVSDAAGVWVPTKLLDGAVARGATVPPIPSDTLLVRSCASAIARFARDVAMGGVDVDRDTEMAVIEVVQSVIDQDGTDDGVHSQSPLILREAVTELIEQNFRDSAFTVDSIAHQLHLSKRHLYRSLAHVGVASVADMITDRRLDWAHTALARPEKVQLEFIAHSAGFASVATLRSRFRARYGITPTEYRRSVTTHRATGR